PPIVALIAPTTRRFAAKPVSLAPAFLNAADRRRLNVRLFKKLRSSKRRNGSAPALKAAFPCSSAAGESSVVWAGGNDGSRACVGIAGLANNVMNIAELLIRRESQQK